MAHIDDYDYEATKIEEEGKRSFRFTINFKSILNINHILMEDNRFRSEDYPRDLLYNLLAGIWIAFLILACFSNGILLLVTLPFIFFYGMAFFSTYRTWKEYEYPKSKFWIPSVIGLIVAGAIGIAFQEFVLKL